MSIVIHKKNPADIYFGNKRVASIYRGNKLVWERVVKHLVELWIHDQCVQFIPSEDIILTDISFMAPSWSNDTNAVFRVLNEAGICIAYSAGNGIQTDVTVYGYTGNLKTSVNTFGTPTLYAGQIYYINITGSGSNGMTATKYDGLTKNMKMFPNVSNINGVYSSTAWKHKCDGSAYSFADICQKTADHYFIWRGPAIGGGSMLPTESGENNPYPYLLRRDMSRIKYRFSDQDFNGSDMHDDIDRYAYIFYRMGTIEGDEFIMNTSHWNQGFQIVPGSDQRYFSGNANKIYTLTGNMARNHITSMTPLTTEPSDPENWGIYFKAAGVTWGSISEKAVVAWNNGQWEIATGFTLEWNEDQNYDGTNYIERISDNYAKDFNNVSVGSEPRLYFKVNGMEI